MTPRVLALTALVGCGGLPEQRSAALEGFAFGWAGLNHRLSALKVGVSLDHSEVAVIGGTSTTGVAPPPPTCDETCVEFPVTDSSNVEIRWAVVESRKTALVPGTVALQVGRDGASGTIEVELPKGARGTGTAMLSGLSLSTDHPLDGGDACYDPAFGWHPRQIAIALGEVSVDGQTATVPVEATFVAGNTLDPDRECIDLVNEQAVVDLTVTVLVAVGNGEVVSQTLEAGAFFAWNGDRTHPEEQIVPEPQKLSWDLEDPLVGFRSIDFRFDADHPEDRGVYLRTFGFWVEPDGTANAVATNYSPGTQFQDFDYAFRGDVVALDHGGSVERGTSVAEIEAELDATGEPVVHSVSHEE